MYPAAAIGLLCMWQLRSACTTITRMSHQGSSHDVLKRGCHTTQADKQASHCSAVLGCFLHLPHIWHLHRVLTCPMPTPLGCGHLCLNCPRARPQLLQHLTPAMAIIARR